MGFYNGVRAWGGFGACEAVLVLSRAPVLFQLCRALCSPHSAFCSEVLAVSSFEVAPPSRGLLANHQERDVFDTQPP